MLSFICFEYNAYQLHWVRLCSSSMGEEGSRVASLFSTVTLILARSAGCTWKKQSFRCNEKAKTSSKAHQSSQKYWVLESRGDILYVSAAGVLSMIKASDFSCNCRLYRMWQGNRERKPACYYLSNRMVLIQSNSPQHMDAFPSASFKCNRAWQGEQRKRPQWCQNTLWA